MTTRVIQVCQCGKRKEQVDQNKENRGILAQATVKANDRINLILEKQTAKLYAALMAKQPQQQTLQDTTALTIKH